jgi:hypothetical protein
MERTALRIAAHASVERVSWFTGFVAHFETFMKRWGSEAPPLTFDVLLLRLGTTWLIIRTRRLPRHRLTGCMRRLTGHRLRGTVLTARKGLSGCMAGRSARKLLSWTMATANEIAGLDPAVAIARAIGENPGFIGRQRAAAATLTGEAL